MNSFRRFCLFAPALLTLFALGPLVLLATSPPDYRMKIGPIAGAVAAICVVLQLFLSRLNQDAAVDPPNPRPKPRPNPQPSNERIPIQLTPDVIQKMAADLECADRLERMRAVQGLVNLGTTPVGRIKCWPTMKCTNLQVAAAEAILREWVDYIVKHPFDHEEDVIDTLFPSAVTDRGGHVRVRRLLRPDEPVRRVAEKIDGWRESVSRRLRPVGVAKQLDEWSDTIKERILDFDITPQASVHEESEGEDRPLAPLDREQFAERFGAKVNEVYGYIAEHVAAAKTDYDLLLAEREIHPLLATLRWEAIATALELRQPDGGPVSIDEVRAIAESLEPAEGDLPPPKPTGDWVSKYRRMRAAGI